MSRYRLAFLLGPTVFVLAVLFHSVLPSVVRADTLKGQPIYAQNNTSRPIWVAAKYIPPGGSNFVTNGFWRINPGERVLIYYNNGVHTYFYARNDNGISWRGTYSATVRGETVPMFEANTGTGFDPFTMRFNP